MSVESPPLRVRESTLRVLRMFGNRRDLELGAGDMGAEHFAQKPFKLGYACAGNDDRITTSMSFFGDSQESSAVVLAELNEEVFALDL